MMAEPELLEYVSCDLCGSDSCEILFGIGRDNEAVPNVACRRCGLVYINPRKYIEKILETYKDGSFSLIARKSSTPSIAKMYASESDARDRFRRLQSYLNLNNVERGKVLEIGCGVGSFLYLMQGAGWDTLGVEPDLQYAATGEAEYNIRIEAKLFEDTNLEPESFDLVAMFHVIEHLSSPRETMTRIREVLRPGGLIYLECPSVDRPYGGNLERFFWSAHLYSFSRATLCGLLRVVGFQPIHVGYRGDFVWVIAGKAQPAPLSDLRFPLDDPDVLRQRILGSYQEFMQRQKQVAGTPVLGRVLALSGAAIRKLRNEPHDFLPAVRRVVDTQVKRLERETGGSLLPRRTRIPGTKTISHFGLHFRGNAGDTLLFPAVRELWNFSLGRCAWKLEPLWEEVTAAKVHAINRQCDGVLVGGGGLFLKDTNANDNSGWQWNCSVASLQQIQKPLIVFAVGNNRFRDQDDFAPVFRTHLTETVGRSAFIGLRNTGSIRTLLPYLPDDLHGKLSFQPCPTTVLSRFYPDLGSRTYALDEKRLALNVAFDRRRLRFGSAEGEILGAIARAMRWANDRGWKVILAIHTAADANVIPWLIHECVQFEEVNLDGVPESEVIRFYRNMPLTIGTRGHSQMIPFGLDNAIISIISHPKMAYFLEDIKHPEWGVDVLDASLETAIKEKIREIGEDKRRDIECDIQDAQDYLWDVTMTNMRSIRGILQ